MESKGLNREKLKILAIVAMVVDHTAWGFVDIMTPLGQIMHIFGRMTLPIMCFFIAEGYTHTSNLRRYIHRMVTFWVISIIPFYAFFHEEYGYRQNIIFDLMLALIALSIMEHKSWSRVKRIAALSLIFIISIMIGGWVIMPILYVFAFYYGKDFKTKAKWFVLFTLAMEVFLIIAIVLNEKYHFSHYDWTVGERLYLLGFILALIPLSFYNGQKGRKIFGKYFFYIFYPAHFCVLTAIRNTTTVWDLQSIYIWLHVAALGITIGCLLYAINIKVSKAQLATVVFMLSSTMYVFGFLLEITTSEVAGVYTATKLQYFAECFVFVSITFVLQELSKRRIPRFVYAMEIVASVAFMYMLFTLEENHIFYTGIIINNDGPFPRMQVIKYGPGFYSFFIYAAMVCVIATIVGAKAAKESAYDRKRLKSLFYAMIVMWMPYLVKAAGLTGGYEIPAVGVALAAFFVCRTLSKYSYLDSVGVNSNNAINFGTEGIIVIDNRNIITYHNEWIHKIFGNFEDYDSAAGVFGLLDAFYGNNKTMEKNGNIYELKVENLIEGGEQKGKILWTLDLTEHYKYLNFVKETAEKDSLTGIYNRGYFENEVTRLLEEHPLGTFFMIDLDNFKYVNDGFGHDMGDQVLKALGKVIRKYHNKNLISGRIGGDEFCMFYKYETDEAVLSGLAETLILEFSEELDSISCGRVTSITIGMAVIRPDMSDEITYNKVYKWADRALYNAKEAGKCTYRFYNSK